MDIGGWLLELEVGRPPEKLYEHVDANRTKHKHSADSSVLEHEVHRDEPRKPKRQRPFTHRHEATTRPAATRHRADHASLDSIALRSDPSSATSAIGHPDLYRRRSRHKTKHDRYEPKTRNSRPKRKSHQTKPTSRPRKETGDHLAQNLHLDSSRLANVTSERVTLKPSLRSGLFRQGISSLPAKLKKNPLNDLTFHEDDFLDHERNVVSDDKDRHTKPKKRNQDQRERVIVQEQQYSDYFAGRTGPSNHRPKDRTAHLHPIDLDTRSRTDQIDDGHTRTEDSGSWRRAPTVDRWRPTLNAARDFEADTTPTTTFTRARPHSNIARSVLSASQLTSLSKSRRVQNGVQRGDQHEIPKDMSNVSPLSPAHSAPVRHLERATEGLVQDAGDEYHHHGYQPNAMSIATREQFERGLHKPRSFVDGIGKDVVALSSKARGHTPECEEVHNPGKDCEKTDITGFEGLVRPQRPTPSRMTRMLADYAMGSDAIQRNRPFVQTTTPPRSNQARTVIVNDRPSYRYDTGIHETFLPLDRGPVEHFSPYIVRSNAVPADTHTRRVHDDFHEAPSEFTLDGGLEKTLEGFEHVLHNEEDFLVPENTADEEYLLEEVAMDDSNVSHARSSDARSAYYEDHFAGFWRPNKLY
ncbi:Hypothetical protein D9617_25g061350 [Elsinoe fawcettii]|nr:Hypothetical protein D9617_25g061350 [Elsinoe fawcettii]